MFKNPGGKLKKLAKILFWCLLIMFILAGVAGIADAYASGEDGFVGIAVVIVIWLITCGVLIAWSCAIGIFAIGSVVEDVQTIKEIQLKLLNTDRALSGQDP